MTAAKKVLDKITSYSSVVIFIAMVLMVTYQVIARYFFKSPSSVTEVLTRYCFVWLIIISATYMFGQREHINISVIKDKLPKTPKMIVSIIIELVTICFAGLVMVFIMVASCISIISAGFQRILKPLVILPFAGIAIAMGAGGHEISRSLVQYLKTFFGFCISGALMVICVKTGVTLCTSLVNFDLSGASNIYKCVLITVQSAITPIVIAGLVKGTDSMVQRMM